MNEAFLVWLFIHFSFKFLFV